MLEFQKWENIEIKHTPATKEQRRSLYRLGYTKKITKSVDTKLADDLIKTGLKIWQLKQETK